MTRKSFRSAVIGCGNIGSLYSDDPLIKGIYTHAEAYKKCPDTQLVAVCDQDIDKSTRSGEKWGVSAYTKISQLLEEQKPEIVSICTPDRTHFEILEAVLQFPSVLGILAEKPLALTGDHAENILNLAKQRNVMLAVNYSRRYCAQHNAIRQIIQAGNLGRIQKVSGYYTKGLVHNGTHWIDLARWFFGEIIDMQGFSNNLVNQDPTIDAWFKFENGISGFLTGIENKDFSLFEMDIVGSEGRIRIIDSGHQQEYYEISNSPYYTGYKTLMKKHIQNEGMLDTILFAVLDLVDCIQEKRLPKCTGEDGKKALEIAQSVLQSSRQL